MFTQQNAFFLLNDLSDSCSCPCIRGQDVSWTIRCKETDRLSGFTGVCHCVITCPETKLLLLPFLVSIRPEITLHINLKAAKAHNSNNNNNNDKPEAASIHDI